MTSSTRERADAAGAGAPTDRQGGENPGQPDRPAPPLSASPPREERRPWPRRFDDVF